ncbi:PREDICTED: protein cappuccino isoform X2 [Nicrophorus vespilloides]|uniref:Protein cappuccino isoform X2 n=1 Tax=Nicrophorus vespilloides TaxID=110193 RepID=A0ABM1M5Q7_NICVS|nr:PREDICTED: protein cappuccino isoform X2 [Nicrophorus vespilloides]
MGNTMAGDAKAAGGKTPKMKNFMKNRGKRGKHEEPQFTDIGVEAQPHGDLGATGGLVEVIETPVKTPEELWIEEKTPSVTSPQSNESSDTHFTDPLTPVEFSTEINECYYSQESVLDGPSSTDAQSLPLNSFKLNEYKARREEVNRKLSKLSVSETSQMNFDEEEENLLLDEEGNQEEEEEHIVCATDEDDDNDNNIEYAGALHEYASSTGEERADLQNFVAADLSTLGDTKTCSNMSKDSAQRGDNDSTDMQPKPGRHEIKRHMSVSSGMPSQETTKLAGTEVLKKVASLTLVSTESKVTRPRFVPEKLDFQLYEVFEGHMLINWYISEFREDEYLCLINNPQDLKLLAIQFCTHLLAAGVLRQISDNNLPMYNIFKPDLMYYWAHSEAPAPIADTPGKLSQYSWPPTYTDSLESSKSASPQSPSASDANNISNKESMFEDLQSQIEKLKQENEKYKTLIDIQTLTTNAVEDFASPEEQTDRKKNGCDKSIGTSDDDDNNKLDVSDNDDGKAVCKQCGWTMRLSERQSGDGVIGDSVQVNGLNNLIAAPTVPSSSTRLSQDIAVAPVSVNITTAPPPPPMPATSYPTTEIEAPIPPPMPSFTCPPPPPMPGAGIPIPPPPPMLGLGPCPPPPPPLPGMGGPPPPPPLPGMGGPPPPPPLPGMGGPPPPPPPPGMCGPPPPPPPPGMGGPPPPPPPPGMGGPPPPPPMGGPSPFPTPPVGGWNANKASIRKSPVNPVAPMKPLYWTRILVRQRAAMNNPAVDSTDSPTGDAQPLWLHLDEVTLDNLTEFTDLFSRQVVTSKPTKKKVEAKPKAEAIKLLDSKRSQNVGILAQSLHVEIHEIEAAIYNFDTSVVSLEALQQIYEARASGEELELIKSHVQDKPELALDKPEQFLYDLAEISNFAERISCFMFITEFDESLAAIEVTLSNIKNTCKFLTTNESLKEVMAIILTLGNYMNGGNMSRGQADGFGLEILAKLKDVKSKDSQTTLLHYIVRLCVKKLENPLSNVNNLPVPKLSDISGAASVNFDDLHGTLNNLQKKLNGCVNRTVEVIDAATPENLEPFKEKMNTFLENAKKRLAAEGEDLEECKQIFIRTMRFYQFQPKSGTLETFPPNDFFELWLQFCSDFKEIWKKEMIRLEKEKINELKRKKDERHAEHVTIKKRDNGLKAKVDRIKAKKAKNIKN